MATERARPTSYREKVMFDQLDRIEAKLDTILSGATFMRELDKNARQLQDMKEIGENWDAEDEQGLQPGDYTDASKATADALTAMGWGWYGPHRVTLQYISRCDWEMGKVMNHSDTEKYHLDPATFLRRAAVTAKEIGLVPVVEETKSGRHWSDCSQHNEPAYPNEPCDCGGDAPAQTPTPWVPSVGEYGVISLPGASVHGKVVKVLGLSKMYGTADTEEGWWSYRGRDAVLRPATDAEIAAHLAEVEAKKPVEFGMRVKKVSDGTEWRVACNAPHTDGRWLIVNEEHFWSEGRKRHEFTVI